MTEDQSPPPKKRRFHLPASYSNVISYLGTVIAVISLFMFVFMYAQTSITRSETAYEGLVIFIFIPAFLIFGLLLIPLGMVRRSRRLKAAVKPARGFPVLDLNKRHVRNAAAIFAAGSILLLFLSALGTYNAYHFTESVTFCGTLCHKVMKPEHTAYQNSPHARVACAACHVGPGANWYVKSKLTGLYQVYATLANVYPRPIPAPIKHLRPARETCEQCHWPQKAYGKQQRLEIHYLPDEQSTRWDIEMLLNTGAGNPAFGLQTGIHWHINPEIEVRYVAADEKRESIPRVILFNKKTQAQTVYTATGEAPGEAELAGLPTRLVDCVDCHNRPSHIYRTPSTFINTAITEGRIDRRLPFIKRIAVQACLAEYAGEAEAAEGIAAKVRGFYAAEHPEVLQSSAEAVERSIQGIQDAFARNIFPTMKVSWEKYTDHIGHLTSAGCFRCHDDRHVSPEGRVIRKDCSLCHTIHAQGRHGEMEYAPGEASLEFKHPEDIGDAWKEGACAECHSSSTI